MFGLKRELVINWFFIPDFQKSGLTQILAVEVLRPTSAVFSFQPIVSTQPGSFGLFICLDLIWLGLLF